jgi:parvulin-like peptidyl-prolyl isomerase
MSRPIAILVFSLAALAARVLAADEQANPPSAEEVRARMDGVRQLMPEVVARATGWSLGRDVVWHRIRLKVERVVKGGQPVSVGLLRYLARPIVNRAIEEHLLGQAAAAAGFEPDVGRADAHLAELLAQPSTREQAEGFLRENGLSRDEYVRELATRTAVTDWVRQRFVATQKVSDVELKAAYEKRRSELTLPATVLLERILVPKTEPDMSSGRTKLLGIRAAIAAGTPFAEAAGAESDSVHYDSQRVAAKALPEKVQEAVAELAMGEVSGIVELPDTLAIVRWSAPLAAREPPFGQVADVLRVNIQEEKGREAFGTYLKKLREDSKVVIYPPLEDSRTPWPAPRRK